jgi:hypothetical protein
MNEETKRAKVNQFLSDVVMSGAVHEIMLKSYLKKKVGEGVDMKAARFIATELLEDAWQELNKYRLTADEKAEKGVQIGL